MCFNEQAGQVGAIRFLDCHNAGAVSADGGSRTAQVGQLQHEHWHDCCGPSDDPGGRDCADDTKSYAQVVAVLFRLSLHVARLPSHLADHVVGHPQVQRGIQSRAPKGF